MSTATVSASPLRTTRLARSSSPASSPDRADEDDPRIAQHSVRDAGFIRAVTTTLMQACVLHRWDPEGDPNMEDVLPSAIVEALRLAPQDRHAIGMTNALLALTDFQERRRVLIQVILAHRVLR